jgi:hypothetical protein
VIESKYDQRELGEGFIRDSIDDCWEPWMKIADEILDDEELIVPVYEALRRRRPNSGSRGRKGTPAEVALRMLALKHIRNWSFDTLEREVRANMVYRMFTRVGPRRFRMPGATSLYRTSKVDIRRPLRRKFCPAGLADPVGRCLNFLHFGGFKRGFSGQARF